MAARSSSTGSSKPSHCSVDVSDEIQQTRYDRLLRRVGGMIGPGSKVGTVVSELFPMIDVENVPGELLALMGTRLGFGGASITAGAGNRGKLQLFNPAGSGKLVTLTTVVLSSNTTQTFRFDTEDAIRGAAVGTAGFRDTRAPAAEVTSAVINFQDDATTIPSAARLAMIADTPFLFTDPNGIVILQPGTGWTVSTETLATSVQATFLWRERVAEQAELSL